MTKEDYMHLSKERLAELLVERDEMEISIEDKIAEMLAKFLDDLPNQSLLKNNPYPNPFQPTTVLYGCPSTFPDIIYDTKTLQDNE